MIPVRLLYLFRPYNVTKCFATSTKIIMKTKSRPFGSKKAAFPPLFQQKLNRWPFLIQLEIDELLAESNERSRDNNFSMQSIDLKYVDYHIEAINGHVAEFKFVGDDLLSRNMTKGVPVILLEHGEKVKKYECVVVDSNRYGVFLKLRGSSATLFNPVTAFDSHYSVMPSEQFGTYQILLEFLKQRERWAKMPGYPILEQVYRAKQLKPVHHDRKLKYFLELNQGQQDAVAAAMNNQRPIVCIQGPPGTGKSHVLTEIILQANKDKKKVLICAPTHQAVNNLMSRSSEYVNNIHVAGQDPTAKSVSVAMKSHSDFDLLARLYEELETTKKNTTNAEALQKLAKKAATLEWQIRSSVLKSSDIIFTTLSSISVRTLRTFGFVPDIVILEEAGQALECASWVALLQAPRAILAGDPSQLSVHLLSQEAATSNLQASLIECVKNEYGSAATIMLTEQYRMNKKIQNWSSNTFYGGKLVPHESVRNIHLSDVSPALDEKIFDPLVFIDTDLADTDNLESFDQETLSVKNKVEAELVVAHTERLLDGGLLPTQIGIITGYRDQVLLIRKKLGLQLAEKIDVCSVDGFQGEEREAIIMSFVRNNNDGRIGFLVNSKRMNVAISRAKRHFMMIGSSKMLNGNKVLSTLVKEFHENGVVLSPDDYFTQISFPQVEGVGNQ